MNDHNDVVKILCVCMLFLLSAGCSQKNKIVEKKIILGTETLSTAIAAELDPIGSNDSIKLFYSALRTLLAQQVSVSKNDTMMQLFHNRILLVSGYEWSEPGARLLFRAARFLALLDDSLRNCIEINNYFDSLSQIIQNTDNPKTDVPWKVCIDSITDLRNRRIDLLCNALGVNDASARLCYDFVYKRIDTLTNKKKYVKKMIDGLILLKDSTDKRFPQKSESKKHRPVQQIRERKNNTARLLAYRNEQSIRDTIAKHIPTIRQFYKKTLKIDATTEGVVVVTFEVSPKGRVVDAKVKTSQVKEDTFLRQFCTYLRSVQFQPVPEDVGPMVFDFPFEFSAEM